MTDAPSAIAEIDLDAVVANWRLLAARVAPADCAAVVKADGYGLGAAPIARALAAAGCRIFFVARLAEGIALRAALPDAEIRVLDGLMPGEADWFRDYRLTPVLNDPGQVAAWRAWGRAAGALPPACLQLDTGMSRQGLTASELARLLADQPDLAAHPFAAVMSHLACADDPDHPMNAAQRARLAEMAAPFVAAPWSLAASSGIFLGPQVHFGLVRPGAALYGVNPTPGRPNPMRPVLTLRARVLQVRRVDAPAAVGYGAAAHAPAGARVATIALGYADGWRRTGSGRGHVVFQEQRLPVLGRISMDLVTIDASATADGAIAAGDWVEAIGPGRDVDAAAAEAGTIGYEILTGLGPRIARRYIGGPA